MFCKGLELRPNAQKEKNYSVQLFNNGQPRKELKKFGLETPEEFDLFAKEINGVLHRRNTVAHTISPEIAALVINNIKGNPNIEELLKRGFEWIWKRSVEDIDKFSEKEKKEVVSDGLYTASARQHKKAGKGSKK